MTVRLYVEGGGSSRSQQRGLRKAFTRYIEKAGLLGNMPRVIACGGRDSAYDDFKTCHDGGVATAILLVDSEGPVKASTPWAHLNQRDGWRLPSGVTDDQCHLMVQIMESWFMADREALADFYGQGFRPNAIPQWRNIETVAKQDVLDTLNRAASGARKGGYHKGRHGFAILGRLDPNKVADVSPHAKRFIDSLKKLSA